MPRQLGMTAARTPAYRLCQALGCQRLLDQLDASLGVGLTHGPQPFNSRYVPKPVKVTVATIPLSSYKQADRLVRDLDEPPTHPLRTRPTPATRSIWSFADAALNGVDAHSTGRPAEPLPLPGTTIRPVAIGGRNHTCPLGALWLALTRTARGDTETRILPNTPRVTGPVSRDSGFVAGLTEAFTVPYPGGNGNAGRNEDRASTSLAPPIRHTARARTATGAGLLSTPTVTTKSTTEELR